MPTIQYQHVLCLYPYEADQRPGIGIWPPTGLEYIATAIKGRVGNISLIDLRYESRLRKPARMASFIRSGVDMIFVSVYWKARYAAICEYIRSLPPGVPIVAGGREASDNVEDLLDECPNLCAVVRGEGEHTVQEIVADRPWDQIAGLSYRKDGGIVHNPNRPLQPIHEIEPPDRSLRQYEYVPILSGHKLLPLQFDTVLSSRGCPYHCTFCTFSLNPLGQKRDYVSRSPESVVDEIESSPARMILFADDNFFYETERVERICDLLAERGIKKRFFANARLEIAQHPSMLEKVYKAGFRMILLGIESASDRILKQMNKGFNTQQVREAFGELRKWPFYYHAYFIYGNVGETEQEMLAIPGFARELGVHSISLSRLRVDKYTPMRKLIEKTPGYRISDNGYVYGGGFDKKKLRGIRDQIRNGFMLRPAQLGRMLSTMHQTELLTYGQMLRLSLAAPLVLADHVNWRTQRAIRRYRERRLERHAAPRPAETAVPASPTE
jgi:anaerobic magnesium-protoporphyrin IX monomethyl ester cyclase